MPLSDLELGYFELEKFLAGDEENGENGSKAAIVLKHIGANFIFGNISRFNKIYIISFSNNLGKKKKDGTQGKPKYAPAQWNMHERVKGDLPLTTNGLEFWHSAIRSIMVESHTSMARFLSGKI